MENVPSTGDDEQSRFGSFLESIDKLPEQEQKEALISACRGHFGADEIECEVERLGSGPEGLVRLTIWANNTMIELSMNRNDAVAMRDALSAALEATEAQSLSQFAVSPSAKGAPKRRIRRS